MVLERQQDRRDISTIHLKHKDLLQDRRLLFTSVQILSVGQRTADRDDAQRPCSFVHVLHNSRASNGHQQRRLKIPQTGRRRLVRALRAADLKATFRILDLPPEIRNLMYEELFAVHSRKGKPEVKYCYPSVLVTNKQINHKANGYLNSVRHADVDVTLRGLERCRYFVLHEEYRLDIEINGLAIYSREAHSADSLQWPVLVRRADSITLKIDLRNIAVRARQAFDRHEQFMVNHALHSLYSHLYEQHQATALTVDVTALRADVGVGNNYEFSTALSTIRALASIFNSATLSLDALSGELEKEMKVDVAYLQRLHAMQSDLNAAAAAAVVAEDSGSYDRIAGEIKRCQRLFAPEYVNYDPGELEEAVERVEGVLKEATGGRRAEEERDVTAKQ